MTGKLESGKTEPLIQEFESFTGKHDHLIVFLKANVFY